MLRCSDARRRDAVRAHSGWNGLDFVEVDSSQTVLTVHFLGKAPQPLAKAHVAIEGGRGPGDAVTVREIEVHRQPDPTLDDWMDVHVDRPGDYSTYSLRLVGLEQIDPRYDRVEFSFKAGCPADLDCAPEAPCLQPIYPRPEIDYLAKDYASFRQLVLDRLSLIMPDWSERHVPDLGIALVEVMAYVGDYLSYYQDAVATEAYLDAARRRPSVRRHVRLVDYVLSEGCNARAFVCIEAGGHLRIEPGDVTFVTSLDDVLPTGRRAALRNRDLDRLAPESFEVFEPLDRERTIDLWKANNTLLFYAWGDRECCLEKGSTRATLKGRLAQPPSDGVTTVAARKNDEAGRGEPQDVHLRPGDFLVLEEVIGPRTGSRHDADPQHRHAVRLTAIGQAEDPLTGEPVIEIAWGEEDALPFDLCLSAIGPATAPECEDTVEDWQPCRYLEDVSVARGNVVLVDHGRTLPPEDLGYVPLARVESCCECEGHQPDLVTVPGRYRPRLARLPLTFAQPRAVDGVPWSAVALLKQDPRKAVPAIWLESSPPRPDGSGPQLGWSDFDATTVELLRRWTARGDLLSSGPDDRHFVVEMEEDRLANLRFGNDELGERPDAGTAFRAHYRVGSGRRGNVGAGAIAALVHVDSDLSNDILRVWNALPAMGGTEPEPMREAKLNAPYAFRFGPDALQRATTAEDYARLAERNRQVQRAAARLVWTGSWFEADIAVDAYAAARPVDRVLADVARDLERYRRIGHDLHAKVVEYVPIDLALEVCIAPDYVKGHVKAALLEAFSSRVPPDGRLGFWHPDRLTPGEDVYTSQIVAAAQAVSGVVSVRLLRCHRQFEPPNREIENGVLPLGLHEVAQLENDRNHPGRGRLTIEVFGGR